jgi:hypothetical protein
MKKLLTIMIMCVMALGAHAQFEQGKIYVDGALTNVGFSYSGKQDLKFGLEAKGGMFVANDILAFGTLGYNHQKDDDSFVLGVGGRYYIEENGIFLGVGGKYVHSDTNYNDFLANLEVGYAFFISRTVTVEPSIYYDQSFKEHSDYSTIGLKVALGLYF